ncbi:MAG: mannosyltransferase OCH1-like enzyme [Arenicella sp.]|jgi:mannosyltransferase OCH1-like enzyme
MSKVSELDPLSLDERNRSNFVRELVQSTYGIFPSSTTKLTSRIPKRIVQFWDDFDRLPQDVKQCMDSWKELEKSGFEIQIFDEKAAKEFILANLGSRFGNAFEKCYHPSMKSDYFRYSYIFVKGGFYVDADDVYHGANIEHFFSDSRLKLQPFCYDISTAQMVSPSKFIRQGANELSWIFYFNTTPLIAASNHPIVERALLNATEALEQDVAGELPEVQATTGPGVLTKSVFEIFAEENCAENLFIVAHDWESASTSKWPLSYRNDKRNWRLSNQKVYQSSSNKESR